TVSDYFGILSRIISDAPATIKTLTQIAGSAGDGDTYRRLTEARSLFERAGCRRLVTDIDGILYAYKNGNYAFAATCARTLLDYLNEFYMRTVTANKSQRSETMSSVDNIDDPAGRSDSVAFRYTTLQVALERLAHEEATRKLRVLAIDDAAIMLRTIYGVLSGEYMVYTMSKPTMLEKVLQHVVPDLFLLDYKMPEISGFELVPIIRSFKEHTTTPIVFLTSMGTVDHISTAILLGACDFVVKPFQPDALREKIAKHIVRKKLF
ncbi:MAG: response regulator, partial [Oscillospiraceae bacterium]|nr:response regulator [Oscillospiraceae bacterium]